MPLPRLGVIFSIKGVGRPVTSLPVGRLLTGAQLIGGGNHESAPACSHRPPLTALPGAGAGEERSGNSTCIPGP